MRSRSAESPPVVPRVRLGERLGAGGFSIVYRGCLTEVPGREVAVKIARVGTELVRARFAREHEAMAAVGAPAVPEVIAGGELADGRPYLVLELVRGVTLAEYLHRPPLPVSEAARLADALLEALGHVHRAGLVHRDLKPQNVLVQPDGRLRLVDFGLARASATDAALTRDGAVVGSVAYAAPEQLRGEPVDARSDLYAAGAILYEMLAGRPPFSGAHAEVERGHLSLRPPPLGSDLPAGLEAFVRDCLAKQPGRRPRDVDAARAGLAGALVSGATPRPLEAPVRRSTARSQPVVLTSIRAPTAPAAIAALVRERGGIIARRRGDELRCAFIAGEPDPLTAAREACRLAVEELGACAVVHLAELRVRRRADGAAVHGAELRSDDWIPEGAWTGLLLTRAAAAVLPAGTAEPDPERDGFARAIERPGAGRVALVARGTERDRVVAAASAALRRGEPALVTVVGAPGTGKSRMADEISLGLGPQVEWIALSRPVASDPAATLRTVVARVYGLEDGAGPEQVGAACRALLGRGLAAELERRVIDLVTGAGGGGPGGQFDATRILGEGLIRRASRAPLTLVLDDAHHADDVTLDAVEYATRRDVSHPICVVVAADERLRRLRPAWGRRARTAASVSLTDLPRSDAADLARALLAPARRVPMRVLERLADWAGGNPAQLTELIRQLHRDGVIRRHGDTDAWYVAEDELDRLALSPAGVWLVARLLGSMSRPLVELSRMCAALAGDFTLDEIEAIQSGVELASQGRASELIDPAVGLERALAHDLLVESAPGRHVFRRPAVQDALYQQLDADQRALIHELAFRYWSRSERSRDSVVLHKLAHHAARSGRVREARAAYVVLSDAARRRHAYAEADTALSHALELGGRSPPGEEVELRIERGWVRLLQTHYEEAMHDLELAQELAEAHGDRAGVVEALVLAAAVCDHTERLAESAELIERAVELAPRELPPRAEARMRNWLGVVRFRQQRAAEAIENLAAATRLAESLGEHVTRVGSMLQLGPSLRLAGRVEEANRVLDQVIEICKRGGDCWHLAMGLNNRMERWRDERNVDAAERDMRAAVSLAAEYGFDWIEIYCHLNMAEVLFRTGLIEEAARYAARAHALGIERFGTNKLAVAGLYYVQLLLLAGEFRDARSVLDDLGAGEIEEVPALRVARDALDLAVQGASAERWDRVVATAREHGVGDQLVEILWLRGRVALHRGQRDRATSALTEALLEARRAGSPLADLVSADLRSLEETGGGHVLR